VNTPEVGKLLKAGAKRDAIHVAIAPVVAAEVLVPGMHVGLNEDGEATCKSLEPIGIVDPYLKSKVQEGQMFYLFLYPNTVTSLRHEWEHPSFDGKAVAADKSISRLFVEKTAAQCGYTYERLMSACERYAESDGSDYVMTGKDEGYKDADFGDEFWQHFSALTGIKAPKWKGAPFSCSC